MCVSLCRLRFPAIWQLWCRLHPRGDDGFIRVEMTGDTNGPCGMYTSVVTPSLNFRRVPPTLLPTPSPSPSPLPTLPWPPPQPPPGALQCLQDPHLCYQAFLYGATCTASPRQAFLNSFCLFPSISRMCPCWCSTTMPPSPPSSWPPPRPPKPPSPRPPAPPPLPWQASACSGDNRKVCSKQQSHATILHECAKNATFRSSCSCTCQVCPCLFV